MRKRKESGQTADDALTRRVASCLCYQTKRDSWRNFRLVKLNCLRASCGHISTRLNAYHNGTSTQTKKKTKKRDWARVSGRKSEKKSDRPGTVRNAMLIVVNTQVTIIQLANGDTCATHGRIVWHVAHTLNLRHTHSSAFAI